MLGNVLLVAGAAQAHATDNSYNYQPFDSFNALGAGATDNSGATLDKTELNQQVAGVGIGAKAGPYAAGGLSTAGINGSSLYNANGVIAQNTNTGVASNLGIATTLSVGSISMP